MTRILVAEDVLDIRELISLTLRHSGFEVICAADGVEAVEAANVHDIDLILLDVLMPRMTGYEACRKLRGQEATRNIPIIFLSAKGQESEVRAGKEAGADDYIIKPFAPAELTQKVRESLRLRENQDDS